MEEQPPVKKVKLLMSLIYSDDSAFFSAVSDLTERYGIIDFASKEMPFTYTDYYEKEMGPGLRRRFLTFSKLIFPDEIVACKLFTMEIEKKYIKQDGGRRVNIDPGILSLERVVLASRKNFVHRIYLGNGIYADLTLIFKKGTFRALEWTYPDYRSEEIINMLNRIRELYKFQIQQKGE